MIGPSILYLFSAVSSSSSSSSSSSFSSSRLAGTVTHFTTRIGKLTPLLLTQTSTVTYNGDIGVPPDQPSDPPPPVVPVWGLLVFLVLFFASLIAFIVVNYAFELIFNLVIVEAPPPAIHFSSETPGAKPNYITSSIRRAVSHLRSLEGISGLTRGLWANILFGFTFAIVRSILGSVLGEGQMKEINNPNGDKILVPVADPIGPCALLKGAISNLVTFILLSQMGMWALHTMIATPAPGATEGRRSRRSILSPVPYPSFTAAKKTIPALALFSIAGDLTNALPLLIIRACFSIPPSDFNPNPNPTPPEEGNDPTKDLMPGWLLKAGPVWFVLVLGLVFGLLLPLRISLVRVQASLLSDDFETIVPVEKTFGVEVLSPNNDSNNDTANNNNDEEEAAVGAASAESAKGITLAQAWKTVVPWWKLGRGSQDAAGFRVASSEHTTGRRNVFWRVCFYLLKGWPLVMLLNIVLFGAVFTAVGAFIPKP